MVLYTWSMHCSHVGPHLATFFSFWVPIFVPRSPFSLLGPHGFWPQCTWSFREPPHNTCKMAISRECAAAKLPHDVEVYGLFAHLLPAVATEQGVELQFARACQGLVPDFRLRLPMPQGPTDTLAELKVISAWSTWHPAGATGTGVQRRAATLAPSYRRQLAKYDRQFHGTVGDERGPLVTKLESFGKSCGRTLGKWVTWPAQPGSYSGKEQGCSKIRGSRLARLRPGARSDHGRDQTGFILGLCQGTSPLPSHPSHQPWGWGWLRGEEDWLLRIRRRGEGCSGRILMLMWKEGGCPELGKYLP